VAPRFFASPAAFRKWLEAHHAKDRELLVGFYKAGSGRPSITWPESVDEALCVGWIDGVRRRIDDESYTIRFTPRRAGSTWSVVNSGRMAVLIEAGRALPAGLAAFARRTGKKSGIYSYEQRESAKLDAAQVRQFRARPAAWNYFQAQAPWYRRTTTCWVVSAKREATRERRLAVLIDNCARGCPIPAVAKPAASELNAP
jgi:uncharacterized protein YdeI (YjbR/CyaY-like superfamily)